jgi:hypothetical protein
MDMKVNTIVMYSQGTGNNAITVSQSIVDKVLERVQEIDSILSRGVITTTKGVISFTLDNQISVHTKMQSTSSRLVGDIAPLVYEIGELASSPGGRIIVNNSEMFGLIMWINVGRPITDQLV